MILRIANPHMRPSRLLPFVLAAACGVPRSSSAPTPSRAVPRVGVRALRHSIDSVVNSPEFANANWGVLAVTSTGDTLYSRNAGKLFMPASNQKLLTSSVALTQLGADFRYKTVVMARHGLDEGVLHGDLYVIGRGDPSFSDHMRRDAMLPLREVAESLSARGIRRITGRLEAAGNAFPDPTLGFGWSWDDLEAAYSAPTDELLFNEGFTNVIVRAGASVGDSAHIGTRPTKTWPTIRGSVTTVARPTLPLDSMSRARRPAVLVRKDTLTGEVWISGTIAIGDSAVEAVTHRDPDAAFLAALKEALNDGGIAVDGTELQELPPPITDTLAVIVSPPLSEILPAFLKPSQNQMGEMLFKTLGLERDTIGTAVAARRVIAAQLKAWGARDDGYVIHDGSGLSRYDYVSPETIIRVLDAMRTGPNFSVFYASLPIAGVDGTIKTRMRGTPAENNVHAKTGSVAQARSLSGFVQSLGGDTVMFSILANNWTAPAREVERAADSIAARLASYRRH
jgi:D-alanyl-D-alanine carboxypeptidase/D-alanyl-D-alanine-endopeptidase (penicillin-binding protein 4)